MNPDGSVPEHLATDQSPFNEVNLLPRATAAAEAVVRIEIAGRFHGTGFMLTPELMLTAGHVAEAAKDAPTSLIA